MKKRGQAAMEFLMTYGWAILVVLVVIGALAYFDVLSPGRMLPKKCQLTTGLVCVDHTATTTGLTMLVNNGLGSDITVTEITFDADNGQYTCTGGLADTNLMSGQEQSFAVAGCVITAASNTRIKGDLTLTYLNLQTSLTHTVTGTLVTDVE